MVDAALTYVLELLERERPADPLAFVAEQLKLWELRRLGSRTATREAIAPHMPQLRAVSAFHSSVPPPPPPPPHSGQPSQLRRQRSVDEVDEAPEDSLDPHLWSVAHGESAPTTVDEGAVRVASPQTRQLLSLVAAAAPAAATAAPVTPDEPLAWLHAICSDALPLPLPAEARAFLGRATAAYLDPFLDGELPPTLYKTLAQKFPFPTRLEQAWAEEHAGRAVVPPMPAIPPHCAVAEYVRHCICKATAGKNVSLRLFSADETLLDAHHTKLSKALAAALFRDFPDEQTRVLGSAVGMGVEEVEALALELSRARLLDMYEQQLRMRRAKEQWWDESLAGKQHERARLWAWGVRVVADPPPSLETRREQGEHDEARRIRNLSRGRRGSREMPRHV